MIYTTEDLVILAGVSDDGQELVGVALVRKGDIVCPFRHRRTELH